MTSDQKIKIGPSRFSEGGYLTFGEYGNQRTAMTVISVHGEPEYIATVNLPDEAMPANHVFIKNWSENEGVLEALQKAGVVGPAISEIKTGMAVAHVVPLLIAPY